MNFRPCIDIHNGSVKQIVGSSLSDSNVVSENFVSKKDSAYYAKLYAAKGLKGGHVIILNKIGTPEYEASRNAALLALNATPDLLQIGGGITDENASSYIKEGASHIIVTSFLFENGELSFDKMKRLKDAVGKEHAVFDLSCKKVDDSYFIATNRWQTVTETKLNVELLCKLEEFCDEYLIHAVDVEGKNNGPEKDLIKELASYDGNKITYAGGIRSTEDIETINNLSNGKMDFTIGSALDIFGGNLSFEEIASHYA